MGLCRHTDTDLGKHFHKLYVGHLHSDFLVTIMYMYV